MNHYYLRNEEVSIEKEQLLTPSSSVKYSISYLHDEDNLRGFDPVSEDDLHDNGMRRYMENDDEEGWY